jgi:methylenetetrahydrofolate reductase (NADPH)
MFEFPYLIEILTPRRSPVAEVEGRLPVFGERYRRILDTGSGVSIPDNPMGRPRLGVLEALAACGLPVHSARTVMNLNTFHSKTELDGLLNAAGEAGIRYLLVVRGDGGPDLSRLAPASIGGRQSVATSMDLLRYIHRAYAGRFVTGAAFNQYNPMPFETDRLQQKIAAGAQFVVTQPVIGRDPVVDALQDCGVPVVVEAWMSANVALLYQSVRKPADERAAAYDPVENLAALHAAYPARCVYLSMLSFKQAWDGILPRL